MSGIVRKSGSGSEFDDFAEGDHDTPPAFSEAENRLGAFAIPPADIKQIEDPRAVRLLVAGELDVLIRLEPAAFHFAPHGMFRQILQAFLVLTSD